MIYPFSLFPDPDPDYDVGISLELGYALLETPEGSESPHLDASEMTIKVSADDLFFVDVYAASASADIQFWDYSGLPAANLTAVLTDVEFGVSTAFLPLPGLSTALYSYVGPELTINICILEPLKLSIENPSSEDTVSGVVPIQATVKTPEGISVEKVMWRTEWYSAPHWAEHREQPPSDWQEMKCNESSGLWEAEWISWDTPDGKYGLVVRVEAVENDSGMRYDCEDRVQVEVKNQEWRIGEQILVKEWVNRITLHADRKYYISHGFVHDNWFEHSEEERQQLLDESQYRFELYYKESTSGKDFKTISLDRWVQYNKWAYFGQPEKGEGEMGMMWDVMWTLWHVQFEEGYFEAGKTYTFKGVWIWPPNPEDPEDPGKMEVTIEVTFI